MNIGGIEIPIPSIPQMVFLSFSAIAVICSVMMVTRRDAVHSALWLVIVLFQLAGMYVLLNAAFLAVLQVLVYAGAILVLFLFVIMLLQLREGPRLDDAHQIQRVVAWPIGLALGVELVVVIVLAATLSPPALPQGVGSMHTATIEGQAPANTNAAPVEGIEGTGRVELHNPGGGWTPEEIERYDGSPRALGTELYTNFLWPFEVASFILLVAVVGAIVLARREEGAFRDVTTRGITLGRGAYPGSPQEAEMAKVLGPQHIPGVVPLTPADTEQGGQ